MKPFTRDPLTFQKSYDATQAMMTEVNATINVPALFAAAKAADPTCDPRTLLHRHGVFLDKRDRPRKNLLEGKPFNADHYYSEIESYDDAWGDVDGGLRLNIFDLATDYKLGHWLDMRLRNEGRQTVLCFGHGKAASAGCQWEMFSDPYDPTKPFEAKDLKSKLLTFWQDIAGGFGTEIKLDKLKRFLDEPDTAVETFMRSVSPMQYPATAITAVPVRKTFGRHSGQLLDLSKS